MAFFEKALEAKVMSTSLLIRANVSKNVLLKAYKIATDFESRYSAYKEDSFLNTINNNAGIKSTPYTEEDYVIFNTSIEISKITNGLFDISIGALSHSAYHFGFTNQQKASVKNIEKYKKLVNYKNITLNTDSIKLEKEGMRLDLGGIGKGYVARQIALFLAHSGASKILVDVGGEIVTRGKSYTIAIKDPFHEENIAYIKTSKEDTAISTSGTYERFIDKENHHILDSTSGASSGYYSSMSILQNGWDIDYLDAYATALFNLSSNDAKEMANKLQISLIFIDTKANISLCNIKKTKLMNITF